MLFFFMPEAEEQLPLKHLSGISQTQVKKKKKGRIQPKGVQQGYKHLPRKAVARKRNVPTRFLRTSYIQVAVVSKFISSSTTLLKDGQECYTLP